MCWKILLTIFVIILVAGIFERHFPVIFWSGEKNVSVKSEDAALQAPEIRTETLPEEKKRAEPEEQRADSADVETNIIKEKVPESSLIEGVPFAVQAPFGKWGNPVFQNGCEEASLVMVEHWLSGKPLSKDIAKQEISALARFEEKWLGHSVDTSAQDTLKLFQDYYGITAGEVKMDIGLVHIREALADGAVVIVPADGRKLKNPHFRQPGPERHMLVIVGYDAETEEFITNDPGTRSGEGYRYAETVLINAIGDYPTGDHLPAKKSRKAMIVVKKL